MPDSFSTGKWHNRKYMPHFEGGTVPQHVTIHLGDSMSVKALQEIDSYIASFPEDKRAAERRKRIEALVDSGIGGCILRKPAVAEMVQNALLHFDGDRYRLLAGVIMPNHVHVLFEPLGPWKVSKVVASWKKWTARKICEEPEYKEKNLLPVWHPEYWDRYIRDEKHFVRVIEYIHYNPVNAGLAGTAEEWSWSSARMGMNGVE
ncbi:hypothetical protein BH09SUM1_BH09SUM1_30940 [soil metagenome]